MKDLTGLVWQLEDYCRQLKLELDDKQAKIDSLMFEYCHEEMTKEQITTYCEHQTLFATVRRVTNEIT